MFEKISFQNGLIIEYSINPGRFCFRQAHTVGTEYKAGEVYRAFNEGNIVIVEQNKQDGGKQFELPDEETALDTVESMRRILGFSDPDDYKNTVMKA